MAISYAMAGSVKQWCPAEFVKLDITELNRVVTEFKQIVTNMLAVIPGDLVLEAEQEMIAEWVENVPVLTAIRIPEMRQRHWEFVLKEWD